METKHLFLPPHISSATDVSHVCALFFPSPTSVPIYNTHGTTSFPVAVVCTLGVTMVQRQVTAALSCFCLGLLQEKSTQTVCLGVINTSLVEECTVSFIQRDYSSHVFFLQHHGKTIVRTAHRMMPRANVWRRNAKLLAHTTT